MVVRKDVQARVVPSPARGQPLQKLDLFLAALASADPVPGGGSSAALAGAMAAGLVGKVCRVTLKSQVEMDEHELGWVLHRADELRDELTTLVTLDGTAYRRVIRAHKSKRPEEMTSALVCATQTPLRIASLCGETLALAASIAAKIRKSVQSDLRVGALIANGALRGAIITAETNLREIRDEIFISEQRAHIARMIENANRILKQVMEL